MSPLSLPSMSELAPNVVIQRLEQRHEQLIAELDALNERLDKALDSFIKPVEEPQETAAAAQ